MKKGKKVRNILSVIVILLFAGSINVSAATFSDVNRSDIFLKQDVSGSSGTCTLSSAAMLIRRAALLSGNDSWSSITESSIKSTAWTTGGLRNGFSYSGINVSSAKISSNKTQTFINLLGAHPEGIVIYDFDKPHAILLTDYTDGVFYCADPSKGAPSGRIPVSKATITVESADKYWYVSSPSLSFTNDNVMPTIQNVKIVERTANGYTVECDVTDNVGVLKVQFPTWESAKTSEGCVWHDGTYVGNSNWRFTYTGATAEGNYTTHIYAWDAAGNVASDNTLAFVYVDRTLPVFENVTVEQKTKVGYTVTCKVSDNVGISKVQFPTWETVKTSDGCTWYDGTHMGNNTWEFTFTGGELGKTYTTDIYAFDTSNNWRCYAGAIELALELDAPQINAIVVNDDLSVDLSFTPVNGAEGYLIYRCTVGGGEWITVGTASTAIFKDIYAKYPGYAFDYSLSAYATKSDGTIFQSDWANSKRIKIPGGVENENENENESDTEGENTVIKDEQNFDCDNLEDEQIEDLHDIVEIEDIILVGMSKKVAAGRMLYLTSCVYPMDATNKNIIWTSSNKKYATVSSSGVVTTNKAGAGKTVTITATAKDGSGAKATYKIKIMKHKVKSVKLKASKKTVKAGKTVKIKSTVKTTGKKVNKTLKWTSSNTEYATVTSKGVVKTKKAGKGKTVTITAMSTDGTNKKAKIKIKIK